MAEAATKRLFFALWPDDGVRAQCYRISAKLPDRIGKAVTAGNLHVTLLFLGQVAAAQQAEICNGAAKLPVSDMRLVFDRLSFWKKPGVLCLTATDCDTRVTALAAQLSAIAIANAITIEDRPYQPHVTLARKAKALPAIEFEPICWHANQFCLVESCSLASGVGYRVLRRYP
jgi:2'-5' RNA ligase